MALDINHVEKDARKLARYLKKSRKQPRPKEIHALRTRVRRLTDTFDALSLNSTHKERRLLRCLVRIRKRAGKVRDMDVLISQLLSMRVTEEAEKDCIVQLMEHLGAQRHVRAARLHAGIRKYEGVIRLQLKQISKRLNKISKQRSRKGSKNKMAATAMASALSLSTKLSRPLTLRRSNLHKYRLKIKKLRDVLKFAGHTSQQAFVSALGKVKDSIGEWHDWEELMGIANDVLDHGPTCKLLRDLHEISTRRFEMACSDANHLRMHYLKSSSRSATRTREAKTSPVVVKAVSHIAA